MNLLILILATTLSLDQTHGSGVLIVRKGNTIVHEHAWGAGVTPQHVFDIGSITKVMTAVAVLQTMPLDLRVGDVFAEAPADKAAITVEQLIRHQSGLPDSLGLDETLIKRDFWLTKLWEAPMAGPSGKYAYSNSGFTLLAAMLEKRTNMPYAEYMRKHVFAPAGVEIGYQKRPKLANGMLNGKPWGATADYFGADGPGWYLMGAGAMHATVYELDRWFAALWAGKLLDAKKTQWFREALTRKDRWGRTILFSSGGNNIFSSFYEWWPDDDVTYILFTSDSEWPYKKLLPIVRPAIIELTAAQ